MSFLTFWDFVFGGLEEVGGDGAAEGFGAVGGLEGEDASAVQGVGEGHGATQPKRFEKRPGIVTEPIEVVGVVSLESLPVTTKEELVKTAKRATIVGKYRGY